MKPITLPLPFFGLTSRIETAPPAPKRAAGPHQQAGLLKPTLRQVLGPRVLQDIGLDDSRRD